MGIYLNPDNKGFRQAIRSEIYVDKIYKQMFKHGAEIYLRKQTAEIREVNGA